MNPDTKATLDDIRIICERHGITYQSHGRITSGFSHEVHRLNDDLILKLYNPYGEEDERRFKTECTVLGSRLDFHKPDLVAQGTKDDAIDRNYIIMTYIPGRSLGSHWHEATEQQREQLIAQISQTLQTINQIDPAEITFGSVKPWDVSLGDGAKEMIDQLLAKGTLGADTADKIHGTVEELLPTVANSALKPVFWDIHFDNFIVDENLDLQAVIDLEDVELTSLDYPLFVVDKLVNDPIKYLREEDEQYANKEDYKNLWIYYQKYYPEMFSFPHLTERVKLYTLLDSLHLLVQWPSDKQLYERINELTM